MSAEENTALVRRFFAEMLNRGDITVGDQLFAVDAFDHAGFPGQVSGREGFKQAVRMVHEAFPDIHYTAEDMVAAGDRVTTRWTLRGTHAGEFLGIAATGKQVTVTGINILRFADGQIVECWEEWDRLGMLQQLGPIDDGLAGAGTTHSRRGDGEPADDGTAHKIGSDVGGSGMPNMGLRAGVGRVGITPPLTAPHASWGAQVHVLPDGVEADLWATALVVSDGVTTAAWVDLDVVIVSRQESDAIREAVAAVLDIPPLAVRVSVTHNHAGPPPSAWNWTRQGQAALDGYYALLPEYAAGAARSAMQNLRSARVAAGSGESRVAVNRREIAPDGRPVTGVNPDGPIDPQVFVLRIDDRLGGPLAAVVGYTMHPTTLGPTNRLISPDWPGHLKRTVETLTGATCLFAQGATGDVGPGPEGYTDDVGVVRRLGRQVGCEAARIYFGLDLPAVRHRHERVWESGAPLGKWVQEPVAEPEPVVRVMTRDVTLPLIAQPPLQEAQARVDEAQRRLDDLKQQGAPAAEIEAATFTTKRANMALSRAETYGNKKTFSVALHLLQIGPAVLVGTEGEPFAEIGMAIKNGSPWPATWFGGYTGGWAGYIPTADAYPLGGYEVDTSPFAPEAAARLVTEALAALRDLEDKQGTETR